MAARLGLSDPGPTASTQHEGEQDYTSEPLVQGPPTEAADLSGAGAQANLMAWIERRMREAAL